MPGVLTKGEIWTQRQTGKEGTRRRLERNRPQPRSTQIASKPPEAGGEDGADSPSQPQEKPALPRSQTSGLWSWEEADLCPKAPVGGAESGQPQESPGEVRLPGQPGIPRTRGLLVLDEGMA